MPKLEKRQNREELIEHIMELKSLLSLQLRKSGTLYSGYGHNGVGTPPTLSVSWNYIII